MHGGVGYGNFVTLCFCCSYFHRRSASRTLPQRVVCPTGDRSCELVQYESLSHMQSSRKSLLQWGSMPQSAVLQECWEAEPCPVAGLSRSQGALESLDTKETSGSFSQNCSCISLLPKGCHANPAHNNSCHPVQFWPAPLGVNTGFAISCRVTLGLGHK